MNNSTWGDVPDTEAPSGHGPREPRDPWSGATDNGEAATAEPAHTQVIPSLTGRSGDAVDSGWEGLAGGDPSQYAAYGAPPQPEVTDFPPQESTPGYGHVIGTSGVDARDGLRDAAPDDGRYAAPPYPAADPGGPVSSSDDGSPGSAANAREPRKKGAGRNLQAAIGVGLGLGAVIVASLLLLPVIFVGIVLAAILVGLWELSTALAGPSPAVGAAAVKPGEPVSSGVRLPVVPLAVGSVAMVVAAYLRGADGLAVAMALTVVAVMVWRMTEGAEDYLRDMTAGVFAALYLPFLASFAVLMLAADDGAKRVLTFMILVVCADTGAYATGFRFGRHKMAPTISPGKTWEGFAGAVLFSAVAGALCLTLMLDGAWWQGAVTGAVVAGASALGDLAESMIKRDVGVKDMGSLLPGHGGLLDRLDSLLVAAPLTWLLLAAFV